MQDIPFRCYLELIGIPPYLMARRGTCGQTLDDACSAPNPAERAWTESADPEFLLWLLSKQIRWIGDNTHRLVARLAVTLADTVKSGRSKDDTTSAAACICALQWADSPTNDNRDRARACRWSFSHAAAFVFQQPDDGAKFLATHASEAAKCAVTIAASYDLNEIARHALEVAESASNQNRQRDTLVKIIREAVPSFETYWRHAVRRVNEINERKPIDDAWINAWSKELSKGVEPPIS